MDLVRSGARQKPIWHAEAQAGPLWLQPQVMGRPRADGRVATPADIRYWSLASFAAGATGWLCPRWRPLLDGPLFGAFGMYGMDGSRTPRSEMTSRLARWATAPEQAVSGAPGQSGAKSRLSSCRRRTSSTTCSKVTPNWYAEAVRGAYQGFFDLGLQPDFVHVDDLADTHYGLVYLPYPCHLRQATADRLHAWVAAGGVLVSEGCPGYFGDHGHVATVQPGLGLHEVFGVRESEVEFAPDLSDDLTFSLDGLDTPVPGALFTQVYQPVSGRVVGRYAGNYSGMAAVIDHDYGAGRTRLVGTFPGVARSRAGGLLDRPGRPTGTTFTTHRTSATPTTRVRLRLAERWGAPASATLVWGSTPGEAGASGLGLSFTVRAWDAVVARLGY